MAGRNGGSEDQAGQVRRQVRGLVEILHWQRGGSWLFIEIDPGFPLANVEALFDTAMELRRS
jgi:hypothetical protein